MIANIVIPTDHAAFKGHFPGNPIVPGVVLIDATLQAIATLTGVSLNQCCLTSIKFLNVVRPGQALILQFQHELPSSFRFELATPSQTVAKGFFTTHSAKEYAI